MSSYIIAGSADSLDTAYVSLSLNPVLGDREEDHQQVQEHRYPHRHQASLRVGSLPKGNMQDLRVPEEVQPHCLHL